eukprot:2862405-Karenia_brevis.AAC.1
MIIPTAGVTNAFNFGAGGKQGGIETPDEWNALLEFVMQPKVEEWIRKGWGAWCDPEGRQRVTHVTWADNIFLFSSDAWHLALMMQDLTDVIYGAGLSWKETSLESMMSSQVLIHDDAFKVVTPDLEILPYTMRESMIVLGSFLDNMGSTIQSVNHRLGQAEKAFWISVKHLCAKGG